MKKIAILLSVLLSLVSVSYALPMISGNITFAGGVVLNDTKDVATQVTSWTNPTVESVSGDFTPSITIGDGVFFDYPWTFGSGLNALWNVGGFTFNLESSVVVLQTVDYLLVSGLGTIIDTNGFYANTPGDFKFSIPGDAANTIFSFAAASKSFPVTKSVPETGATFGFFAFGIGLLVVARKKLLAC